MIIAIIGGIYVDLIMVANRIPDSRESVLVNEHRETFGGKGAFFCLRNRIRSLLPAYVIKVVDTTGAM